jgi:O-antigen ligase
MLSLNLGLGLTKFIPGVVYALGIISVLFALFYKRELALIFLVALLPFTNVLVRLQQFPLGKDYVDIILMALLIGWIIQSYHKREKFLERTPFDKILIFLVIYTFIELWFGSLHLGLPITQRLATWKNYMILPLLFFLTVNTIKDRKKIKWIVIIMIIVIFVMGLYFFKDYRWISKEFFREEKRGIGTFVYLGPNEWGAFHSSYLFIALCLLLLDKSILRKMLYCLAILFSLYSVLFSYSRGAYSAVIIGLVFISLTKKRVLLMPLILFLIFWQSLLPPAVVERISLTKTEEGEYDSSSQKRIGLWETGIAIFSKNPLIGEGFNTMPFVGLGSTGEFADPHNIYVKTLAEQGIIGLLVFLSLLFLSLKSGWKLYKNSDDYFLKGLGLGLCICIVSLMVANCFGDRWTYLQVGGYFWVFLGLVVRGNIIVQGQIKSKKKNKINERITSH